MNVVPGALGQPLLNDWRLVRGVVVDDEMDCHVGWDRFIDLIQKLPKLDGPMARKALANDIPGQDIQRSEQRCRAVSNVVVGAALDLPGTQRQQRLGSVERL